MGAAIQVDQQHRKLRGVHLDGLQRRQRGRALEWQHLEGLVALERRQFAQAIQELSDSWLEACPARGQSVRATELSSGARAQQLTILRQIAASSAQPIGRHRQAGCRSSSMLPPLAGVASRGAVAARPKDQRRLQLPTVLAALHWPRPAVELLQSLLLGVHGRTTNQPHAPTTGRENKLAEDAFGACDMRPDRTPQARPGPRRQQPRLLRGRGCCPACAARVDATAQLLSCRADELRHGTSDAWRARSTSNHGVHEVLQGELAYSLGERRGCHGLKRLVPAARIVSAAVRDWELCQGHGEPG